MNHSHDVEITVNNNLVVVEGPRTTGFLIKQNAINQGVNIQLDFVLYQEISEHHTKMVGDDDEVTVHPNSHFTAVANDDNS